MNESQSMQQTSDSGSTELGKTWRAYIPLAVMFALGLWLGSGDPSAVGSDNGGVPKEISAQSFVVKDDQGNVRASLGFDKRGDRTSLAIWNKGKSAALSLSVDDSHTPRIVFENSKGEALLDIGIMGDESPVFIMRDRQGNRRLIARVKEDGVTGLSLNDAKGKNRMSMLANANGEPMILLKDKSERLRADLTYTEKAGSSVDLYNENEDPLVVLLIDADGNANAVIFNEDGTPVWSARQ